ncbi:MAG: 3-hydroxyacyl-CoA dehydrogenase NAD-binding domain-containing protein [Pseudomonadota bacterium]
MAEVSHTAILGAGVIGASWAALFLASGKSVAIYDPHTGALDSVKRYVATAWPTLEALGLANEGNPDAIESATSARSAVEGADFVQENVPERLPIKHATFAEIEPALADHAVVASSASGLMLRQMQEGWRDPARFVLGHPFNPPHLIPLVEVLGNNRTDESAIQAAEAFYASIGKVTIRLRKEKNGHVANRLQAALWREAISLVGEGVASVEDVDKAVWAGPGLRWAAMGPTSLFNLGAGEGGLEAFIEHFAETFEGWWAELGSPTFDTATRELLLAGTEEANAGRTHAALASQRDALILALLTASKQVRDEKHSSPS